MSVSTSKQTDAASGSAWSRHRAGLIASVSWATVAWIAWVFLNSIPYKFTQHPDTQHIFGTIGAWLGGLAGESTGAAFAAYGPYVVGGFELLTTLVLLAPALAWLLAPFRGKPAASLRPRLHRIGGLMASAVMAGAVFFHLATPLGIEVLHQGESDGGSLFRAAVSILILGGVLYSINRQAVK